MINKWKIALTTNPSIARAVGMLLDIIDNCGYQMYGAPIDDGENVIVFIQTNDDIVIPLKLNYN